MGVKEIEAAPLFIWMWELIRSKRKMRLQVNLNICQKEIKSSIANTIHYYSKAFAIIKNLCLDYYSSL